MRARLRTGPAINLNIRQQSYAYKKSSPHAILNSFADDLKLLPIGPRTEQAYYACLRQLSEHYAKSPDLVSPEDFRQYCIHLKEHKHVARQTSTQAICAFKIFWEKTLRRPWPAEVEFARANPETKLPVILSANEVRRTLAKVPALDHRVCLTTIYSCGLRLGEGLRLQVSDIDSERMFLHLRGGKGNQDRYVPLPERTLALLREQWKSLATPRCSFPPKATAAWAPGRPPSRCPAPPSNAPSAWRSRRPAFPRRPTSTP